MIFGSVLTPLWSAYLAGRWVENNAQYIGMHTSVDALRRCAIEIESSGFDLLLDTDQLSLGDVTKPGWAIADRSSSIPTKPDLWIVTSALLEFTRRLHCYTTVATPFANPYLTARTAATLSNFYPGRLGINFMTVNGSVSSTTESSTGIRTGNKTDRQKELSTFLKVFSATLRSFPSEALAKDRRSGRYWTPSDMREISKESGTERHSGFNTISHNTSYPLPLMIAGHESTVKNTLHSEVDALFTTANRREFPSLRAGITAVRPALKVLPTAIITLASTVDDAYQEHLRRYGESSEAKDLTFIGTADSVADELVHMHRSAGLDGIVVIPWSVPDSWKDMAPVIKLVRQRLDSSRDETP